jgi:hypothetical protein
MTFQFTQIKFSFFNHINGFLNVTLFKNLGRRVQSLLYSVAPNHHNLHHVRAG